MAIAFVILEGLPSDPKKADLQGYCRGICTENALQTYDTGLALPDGKCLCGDVKDPAYRGKAIVTKSQHRQEARPRPPIDQYWRKADSPGSAASADSTPFDER